MNMGLVGSVNRQQSASVYSSSRAAAMKASASSVLRSMVSSVCSVSVRTPFSWLDPRADNATFRAP